jgi:nitrite reductase/ring-hydroxylating ferredoxin subunit
MTWIYVLDEDEIDALPEGSIAHVSPLEKNIFVTRNGRNLLAVSGTCPHMGYSMDGAERFGKLNRMSLPWNWL